MSVTESTFDAAAFSTQALSSQKALAAVLDHTLLKADATQQQVEKLCEEAAQFGFACAMVNPFWTELAASALKGTGVPTGVVIGFPLGATLSASKLDEADRVTKLGAHDVDMVLNIGSLKSGDFQTVRSEIRDIAALVHDRGAILKVILETCLLNFEEKLRASELAVSAGADFIKTSTGFSTSGATVDDIELMRGVAGTRCGVKASGGIRSLGDARSMLQAGATRIGASASIRIVHELTGEASASANSPSGY
jgi:deoxyribose-phosphate aldolase